MHSLEEVRREYDRLDSLLGIDTSRVELKISKRPTRRLGSFRYPARPGEGPLVITLSSPVMEDDALFLDTVRHEYAHAAAYIMQPGVRQGHGRLWKQICRRIGCEPKSTVQLGEESEQRRASEAKYIVRCKGCGRETYYLRRGRNLELIMKGREKRLRCTDCGNNDFEVLINR